jgi:hypothetical protein
VFWLLPRISAFRGKLRNGSKKNCLNVKKEVLYNHREYCAIAQKC